MNVAKERNFRQNALFCPRFFRILATFEKRPLKSAIFNISRTYDQFFGFFELARTFSVVLKVPQKYRLLHCYGFHLSFEFGKIALITFGDFAFHKRNFWPF